MPCNQLYLPYVQVRPGETVTVHVHASWLSGISLVPFVPMTFTTEDLTVATVAGSLPTTARVPIQVTGHRPGVTQVRVDNGLQYPTMALIVVAERELPVAIGINGIAGVGQTITLSAVSDAPDATFTWYQGRLNGLYTWEAGTGRELTLTLPYTAIYEYWVLMTTPDGAGAAGIVINTTQPQPRRKRRVVDH